MIDCVNLRILPRMQKKKKGKKLTATQQSHLSIRCVKKVDMWHLEQIEDNL